MRSVTTPLLAGLTGCLAIGTIGAPTALAGTTPAAAVAAVSVSAPAAGTGIAVKWDWTMPTFMVDKKTFVPTDDPSDPDWAKGGSYVPGPDGIPDRPMKELKPVPQRGKRRLRRLAAFVPVRRDARRLSQQRPGAPDVPLEHPGRGADV